MEVHKSDKKTSSILKKLERYLSINRHTRNGGMFTKSSSWHSGTAKAKEKRHLVAPSGCFSVYVGPERQRFVVKTEFANHPLFRMLLEDAELEYGHNSEGPLVLPCEVDLFYKVLAEMDSGKELDDQYPPGFGYGSCSPFNPARRLGKGGMAKGYASYGLLTPPRLLKINHF